MRKSVLILISLLAMSGQALADQFCGGPLHPCTFDDLVNAEQERNDLMQRQLDQQLFQQDAAKYAGYVQAIYGKLAELNRVRAQRSLGPCHLADGGVDAIGRPLPGDLVCPTAAEDAAAEWRGITARLAEYNRQRRAEGLKPCRLKESFGSWNNQHLETVHAVCP
jgi:hypothetical protein